MKHRIHHRAVWISDLHLGFRGCKAPQLLTFLRSIDCDYLYLVGDVFDLIAAKKSLYWDDVTTAVVRRILKMVGNGTTVVYVPGNHDDAVRKVIPFNFGQHFFVCDTFIHALADGRKMLILHGDQFDFVVGHLRWLSILGSHVYDLLLASNSLLHFVRVKLGYKKYWSLSKYLKAKTKQALSFMRDFETSAAEFAKSRSCEGVVCGHIHTAKLLEANGFTYANCGDWVESLSALVESPDGVLSLVYWHDLETKQVSDARETGY